MRSYFHFIIAINWTELDGRDCFTIIVSIIWDFGIV